MPLSLAELEEIREECMAEDVPIDLARMASWTHEQAQTFFENGGEAEHEVSAWLREIGMLHIEGGVRLAFDSLAAIQARVAIELDAAGPSSNAANLAVGSVIGSLKLGLKEVDRAKLRGALKTLCGCGEAPPAALPPAPPAGNLQPTAAQVAHTLPGAMPIGAGKKVILRGVDDEPAINGKLAEVMVGEHMPAVTDPASGGKYCVKLMHAVAGHGVTGRAQNDLKTLRFVNPSQLLLHPDQVEKDRLAASEGAIVLLGGDDAEREARAALYSLRLDPQHWYDAAVERVLNARHEFEVLRLPERWCGGDLSTVKRAYRKISASVHPDKNSHPQAVDAFRKVYGAFETLLDLKQQWRCAPPAALRASPRSCADPPLRPRQAPLCAGQAGGRRDLAVRAGGGGGGAVRVVVEGERARAREAGRRGGGRRARGHR
jgi:hypothetical protein